MEEEKRYKVVVVLCVIGLTAAVVAGLSNHVSWLAAACGSISQGCKETTKFVLFGLPVWSWGAIFYVLVALCGLLARRTIFWWVAGAAGVEASLVWIALTTRALCIFCLANLVIVALLAVVCFERARMWQMLSVGLASALVGGFFLVHQNGNLLAAQGPQDSAVVAEVAGQPVTSADLERPLTSRIYDLELQIYRMKREFLDEIIAQKVLEEEAKRRGMSIEQFISQSDLVRQVEVTPREIEDYYRLNRARWPGWSGSEEELRARMKAIILQQKTSQKVMELAKSLYAEYGVVDNLKSPPFPHTRVRIGDAPSLGPADAPVTVIEFSDYQCPACRATHQVVQAVKKMYAGKIRWVFKDFPLAKHKAAEKAAEAARCAGDQGKFWEYQDVLFSSKEELSAERLVQYAKELGLDEGSFSACLSDGKYRKPVAASYQDGQGAGVGATPSFIINGSLMTGGASLERFKEIIDGELGKLKQSAALKD